MRLRSSVSRRSWLLTMAVATAATLGVAPLNRMLQKPDQKADQNKKPSISLRANPPVGFSPLRVVVTAELKGGANDYEDFYCASVEWDWGDDTKSESKADCDPYEAGKSEIKRRFVAEHTFRSLTNDMPGARWRRNADRADPVPRQVRAEAEEQDRRVGSDDGRDPLRHGRLAWFSVASSRRRPSGRGRRPCRTCGWTERAPLPPDLRAGSSGQSAASGSSPTPCIPAARG